ncbi:MAG: hypothetical protein H6502_01915 [Candidatus Woesearchaeota archaeon]|nr:MAG: hypothetical protein H6502_01915 [Candidatus Woesearchaeota archaeon]
MARATKKPSPQDVSTNWLVILVLLVLLVSVSLIIAYFSYWNVIEPDEVRRVPYDFYVSDLAGFDVGTDAIHLGTLTPGSAASRTLFVTSPFPSDVFVSLDGACTEFLWVRNKTFSLAADETFELQFHVTAPPEEMDLNCSGDVVLAFYEK